MEKGVKIVFLGGKEAQKTRLLRRLCGRFDDSSNITVGVEFYLRQF